MLVPIDPTKVGWPTQHCGLSMSSPPLTRPIKPVNRTTSLYTIDEACAYLISLPIDLAGLQAWERAALLARKAAQDPTNAALDEFTGQLELALFVTDRLDLTVGHTKISNLLERARTGRAAQYTH